MWALKRASLPSKSWRSVTLRELLGYIRDQAGLTFEIRELGALTVGKYLINQATGAQVFDDLKKRFGLNCFFRSGVLVAGQPYDKGTAATHRYGFRQNVIESDLAYTSAADGVHVLTPAGQPLGRILFPETVSNVAFGGPDGTTLFVTASSGFWRVPTTTRALTL